MAVIDPIEAMQAFLSGYDDACSCLESYDAALSQLCQAIDLQPFLLNDGRMGVHLMNMSFSYDTKETLASELGNGIEMAVDGDEPEDLIVLRDILAERLRAADAALAAWALDGFDD